MAYTTIDKPSDYMRIQTWSGNNSADREITWSETDNMQPDWVWVKRRSDTANHRLADSVRGATKILRSDTADAESTESDDTLSFDTNGFSVGNNSGVNKTGDTYVGWGWKGGTTASGTTNGSKAYSYSANTSSGFSVVTYTGNATAGHLIPHGMGKVPRLIHVKSRGDDNGWTTGTTVSASGWNDHAYLHLTNAFGTDANQFGATPTTSSFRLGTGTGTNGNNGTRVAYCFADVQGYQKIGKYIGTSGDTFVYTGFQPKYIFLKWLTGAENWSLYDIGRNPINGPNDSFLVADTSSGDNTNTDDLDILSNGFLLNRNHNRANANGQPYVYLAIAEHPFVTSTGIPTTAF